MNLSALVKYLTGFGLAIAFLFFAGVNATRYFITRLTAPPPRPTFPNDSPSPTATPTAAVSSPSATPAASPSPSPVASPTSSATPEEGYAARVVEPLGLIVRQEPTQDSEQVGGVDYEGEVTVLETSSDGDWQRVRLDDGTEGWVKAGNTEQVN